MGFYGNITNTAKTQFQFDRIYPNRYEMEKNKSVDGVYQGRYVLIEYDTNLNLDDFDRVFFKGDIAYLANDDQAETMITGDIIAKGDIVYTSTVVETPEEGLAAQDCVFYICIEAKKGTPAKFKYAVGSESNYVLNFNIDTEHYGASRGYDSTVYQKVFDNGQDKYIMIAELNTVVPTFDIVADAPTMTPILPHFDIDSTDVYYKLHMQPQWGFRVKECEEEKDERSDIKVNHIKTTYDPKTGIETTTTDSVDGAIYFNKAAFKPQVGEKTINKTVDGDDYISVLPTGVSGNEYSLHDGASATESKADIQELSINLPSIGNMMSKAWDLIHGENRDDNTSNSLQGRLNFFNKLGENEIPVQAQGGYLVGSMINGNTNRVVKDQGILEEKLSESFESDDAWIKTVIQTQEIAKDQESNPEDPSYHQNAISVHHTFHGVDDTITESDKNTKTEQELNKQNGENKNDLSKIKTRDELKLYTPYVDAAGHVVGNNIETVTLPYGYKIIKAENTEVVTTPNSEIDENGQIADNTQDTINFNASNRWIKIDNKTEDVIKFGHRLGEFAEGTKANTLYGLTQNENHTKVTNVKGDLDKDNTFEVPCLSFDEAGHITEARTHTVSLPENFDKIKVDVGNQTVTAVNGENKAGTIEADSLTDELTLKIGNRWIQMSGDSENDTITFAHAAAGEAPEGNKSVTDENQNKAYGSSFDIPNFTWDEAGHIYSVDKHTITFPEPTMNNFEETDSSVLTGITMISDKDQFKITQTNKNVGELTLAGYQTQVQDGSKILSETDTLNDGLSILEKGLVSEISRASAAENTLTLNLQSEEDRAKKAEGALEEDLKTEIDRAKQAEQKCLDDAKKYADDIKDSILGEDLDETFDTLKEIHTWIVGDGVNATELTEAIAEEAKVRKEKDDALQQAIEDERDRAIAVEGAKFDKDTVFDWGYRQEPVGEEYRDNGVLQSDGSILYTYYQNYTHVQKQETLQTILSQIWEKVYGQKPADVVAQTRTETVVPEEPVT